MIPEFPEFKKLELSDKKDVERFTHHFPHHSDFNFSSMWSWDIHHGIMLSQLNENLIVLFNDYISGEHFLSFMGSKEIVETASKIILFSEKHYHKNFLKLIPEEMSLHFKNTTFYAKEDRDSFDYIYLVEHLVNMKNWTKHPAGRKIRKFIKNHPDYIVRELNTKNISQKEYEKMFEKWSKNKEIESHFELNEYKAFKRLIEMDDQNIKFISIYIDGILAGFSVYEILSNNYALAHFSKADTKDYPGIYDVLNWEEAKFFHKQGIKYLNWEQDLGIPGLRYSKIKYEPAFFLRKLHIEPLK